MRARTWAVTILAAAAAAGGGGPGGRPAFGQDNPNPDQLRKMYDDALAQLKAAQDRKNQLAAENEKLGQQVEALRRDLAAAAARADALARADAEHAERTFYLRAHQAAWRDFLRATPETEARWRAFVNSDYLIRPREYGTVIDRDWPAALAAPTPGLLIPPGAATRPAETQPSASQPATTQPATVPAATQPATASSAAATQPAATAVPTATQPAASQSMAGRPATQPGTGAAPATLPAGPPVAATTASLPATAPATPVVPATVPTTGASAATATQPADPRLGG